jgi:hypothetical protein
MLERLTNMRLSHFVTLDRSEEFGLCCALPAGTPKKNMKCPNRNLDTSQTAALHGVHNQKDVFCSCTFEPVPIKGIHPVPPQFPSGITSCGLGMGGLLRLSTYLGR